MLPIKGTEQIIECDTVILSVGLIPENEIAEMLGIKIDAATKGPVVDQNFMTSVAGVFSCGNSLHVNDLVDYVSESGEIAGDSAAQYVRENLSRELVDIQIDNQDFLYVVPQHININTSNKKVILYFRSREVRENMRVTIRSGDNILFSRKYVILRPPEMERVPLELKGDLISSRPIEITMEPVKDKGVAL